MKVFGITNVAEFFKAIDTKCQGDVYLVSKDGNTINLKSKLTQYVALAEIFKDAEIPELELRCTRSEDAVHIIEYIISR